MEKFMNKYRIASARMQNWDYSSPGAYFITICTKNREHTFGEIADGKMKLSPVGIIADICWYEIKNHARQVELGEYIIMPNHVHGIVILGSGGNCRDKACLVSTIPPADNDFKTRVKIPFHPLLADINPPLPNMPTDWDLKFSGRAGSTIT